MLWFGSNVRCAHLFHSHESLSLGSAPHLFTSCVCRYLIDDEKDAINPKKKGTKVAAHYPLEVEGGQEVVVQLRLSSKAFDAKTGGPFGKNFDTIFPDRKAEADTFYEGLYKNLGPQQALISRQAYAGESSVSRRWNVRE